MLEVFTAALLEAIDDATAAPLHNANVLVTYRIVLSMFFEALLEAAVTSLVCPHLLMQAVVTPVHRYVVGT